MPAVGSPPDQKKASIDPARSAPIASSNPSGAASTSTPGMTPAAYRIRLAISVAAAALLSFVYTALTRRSRA